MANLTWGLSCNQINPTLISVLDDLCVHLGEDKCDDVSQVNSRNMMSSRGGGQLHWEYQQEIVCDGAAEVWLDLEAEWVQSELNFLQIIIESVTDLKQNLGYSAVLQKCSRNSIFIWDLPTFDELPFFYQIYFHNNYMLMSTFMQRQRLSPVDIYVYMYTY